MKIYLLGPAIIRDKFLIKQFKNQFAIKTKPLQKYFVHVSTTFLDIKNN